MNLALMEGARIFNDAILLTRKRRIQVRHEVPEHTEDCEMMRIPTEYDFTNWNDDLNAWQCQFCQRIYDTNSKEYVTEEEYRDSL
jgi:hypothetical protein